MATYSDIRARESAQKYQVTNVRNRFSMYTNAVFAPEQEYVNSGTDLVSLGNTTKDPLVLLAEKSTILQRIFRKKPRAGQDFAAGTDFWSDKWMQGFADSIIIFVGLLMLYGPMWWLNWVSNNRKRLGIITGFVTLFAVGLRLISGAAKPFEVLGATAA
jgi:hypothetical protein